MQEKKFTMSSTVDRSMVKFCKTSPSVGNQVKFERYMEHLQSSKVADNNETIWLNVVYVVIPLESAGNISTQRIQAQHDLLNLHFDQYQKSDLVPAQNARYPYANIWGDPNVQFYPANAQQLTEANGYIIRLNRPSSFPAAGYSEPDQPMNEFLKQGYKCTPGTVYIFISTLESDSTGSLLGMAQDIIANYLMIHFGTVGSDSTPGAFYDQLSMRPFSYGKTMLHELGHCFGLWHPFSGTSCNDSTTTFIASQNPQSPVQINPNFAGLEKVSNITSGACGGLALDNRARDFLRLSNPNCNPYTDPCCGLKFGDSSSAPKYSCASSSELNQASTPFETVMMFMDYAQDEDRIGFPSATVTTLRSVLLNYPELFTVNAATFPSTALPNSPVTTPASSNGPVVTISTESSGTSTSLPAWEIATIVVASLLGVLLLALLGRWLYQRQMAPKFSPAALRPAAAYVPAHKRKQYL